MAEIREDSELLAQLRTCMDIRLLVITILKVEQENRVKAKNYLEKYYFPNSISNCVT
jgi:hypothetical protein